jgi:MFS family permease
MTSATIEDSVPRRKISRQASFFHPYSRRLHLILLLMTGFFCASYMRSNLGMSMTCIVNTTGIAIETSKTYSQNGMSQKHQKQTNIPPQCMHDGLDEEDGVAINDYGGTIIWSQNVQNQILSGTFWGSLVAVLPSGYLADKTSPMNLFQISILIYVTCTTLFPFLANNTSYHVVFFSRFIMGLGEGILIPAANALITRWVPNQEKSTAAAIFTLGNQFAGSIGIPIVAAFCASSFQWPAVFYFCAILGLIWSLVWRLVVTNAPEKAKKMSTVERKFLEANIEKMPRRASMKFQSVPWLKIFTSMPVLACFVSISAVNMVIVLLQAFLPTFLKEVLYLKLSQNGFYSAAPFVVQIFSKLFWSIGLDYLKATNRISNTAACKVSQCFATFTIGIFLILIPHFADCARPEIALFMFCAVGFGFATCISGFYTSMLSVAPAYVGIISSVAQFLGNIGMLVCPALVSFFRVYGTLQEWKIIFYIIAIYTIFSGVFFLVFGTGDTLEWGRGVSSSKHNPKNEPEEVEEFALKSIEVTFDQ